MIATIAVLVLLVEPGALKESVLLAQQAARQPVAHTERHPRPRPSPDRGAALAELLAQG